MNRFTNLVGCAIPLQQAGMSGTSTSTLAAAVSNAGGLVLRSSIDAATAATTDVVGEFKAPDGEVMPVPRFGVSSPNRDMTGDISAMALYAGRSVGSVDRVMSAAEVVAELSAGFD